MDKALKSDGLILDDRYRLLDLLGEGGSGSTYRALRLSDEAVVAIKVLSLRHLNDWKQLELFEREAQILASLNHPQIPKYLEYFHVDTPTDRAFYIVQQLAPGQPLNALVQSGWHGTEAEIKSIAVQILEILQYLQSQSPPLIHRDIKPHNIVRSEDGQVFLVDFGAVQATYHNTLMKGNTVAGTYGYMAPEQFRGRATPPSDLYGLGATVLYLLTHRSPADLPQERLRINFRSHVSLSDSFADWLETMLEPDLADRFPSAQQALQALTGHRYRRVNSGSKNAFPWRGAVAATILSICGLSAFHQYRYAFLTIVGLEPKDLCSSISQGESNLLDDYLQQGGNANVSVYIEGAGFGNDQGSLLHCAVAAKQLNITKQLIRRGADVMARDSAGKSVLHRLVPSIKTFLTPLEQDLFRVLAQQPKLLAATDRNGETPLFLAVRQRQTVVVNKLLELGANPQTKNTRGANLLHALAEDDKIASHNSNTEILYQDILQALLDRAVDLNGVNAAGDRPIDAAIHSHNTPMLKLLLEKGANIHARNKAGRTPLMVAIEKSNVAATKLLLEKGANVNDQDPQGYTPTILVAQNQRYQSPQHYSPAIPTARNQRWTPKPLSTTDQTELARRLLKYGADPNLSDQAGRSPLHWLVSGTLYSYQFMDWHQCSRNVSYPNFDPLLNLWLQQGARQQAVDHEGRTALHMAIDNAKVFKQLVGAGWDPLVPNRQGNSPLQLLASRHGISVAMTREMANAAKNINKIDAEGNTILHRMFQKPQLILDLDKVSIEKTIALLVELGASMDIRNKAGHTPLDLARKLATGQPKNSKAQVARAYLNQCKIEVDQQWGGVKK